MSRNGKINNRIGALHAIHARHAEMLEAGQLGVDDSKGRLAIIACADPSKSKEFMTATRHAARLAFLEVRERRESGVISLTNPSRSVIDEVLADRTVSSLTFIGHGNMGSFRLKRSGQDAHLNWNSILSGVDFLRTGSVEQRTCGGFTGTLDQISMPLGTFLVADQRRVALPLGRTVSTAFGSEGFNDVLSRPLPQAHNTIDQLIDYTGQRQLYDRLLRRE